MNDIKATFSQALDILGCDPACYTFTADSPIVMTFGDVGEILFDASSEPAWLWGSLPDGPEEALRPFAFELLLQLSAPVDYLSSGCLGLRVQDQVRHVGGPLADGYLQQPQHLAAAIEAFYLRMVLLHDLVR